MTKPSRPASFDRNLIVIGAGAAGLVCAWIAAMVKAKVGLIERDKMGGDCLNTGCVPSKTLIKVARLAAQLQRADEFGIRHVQYEIDFPLIMERVHRTIKRIAPHDSVERFSGMGVECLQGDARISSPWTVEVDGKQLSARNIIIASGASPYIPPIPGIEQLAYLSSETLWDLRELPKRLAVIGGGPVGCELAQAFARLGSQVTLLEVQDRLFPDEDPDISELLAHHLRRDGVDVRTGYQVQAVSQQADRRILLCRHQHTDVRIEFDQLLIAAGRRASVSGLGLEALGVVLNPDNSIQVNRYLQSAVASIFACGDVVGPYQFTHAAAHQAWYATINALFGRFKRFKIDHSLMPWAVFTDPELARVGLNEQQAKAQHIDYECTIYPIAELDRAITEGEGHGVVKLLTVPRKDKILGVTVLAHRAGEIITEYISAMKNNIGLNKLLGTIHIYPTLSEANKLAAGQWKRAHIPHALLKLASYYHRWMRS